MRGSRISIVVIAVRVDGESPVGPVETTISYFTHSTSMAIGSKVPMGAGGIAKIANLLKIVAIGPFRNPDARNKGDVSDLNVCNAMAWARGGCDTEGKRFCALCLPRRAAQADDGNVSYVLSDARRRDPESPWQVLRYSHSRRGPLPSGPWSWCCGPPFLGRDIALLASGASRGRKRFSYRRRRRNTT